MKTIVSTLFLLSFIFGGLATQVGVVQAQSDGGNQIFLPALRSGGPSTTSITEPGICLTSEEAKLGKMINDYRAENKLAPVTFSTSLSKVAQWHVRDLQDFAPNTGTDSRGLGCNLHSWSSNGPWSPVCYTADHKYGSSMWQKPNEVTQGVYKDSGFEIAVGGPNWTATAEGSFNAWKGSPGHNDVILEKGSWAGSNWPAMGIGIYQGYAVVWFGKASDPAGPISPCK